jgi:carboxyl-terminal processing protease
MNAIIVTGTLKMSTFRKQYPRLLVITLAATLLIACGGGSSGGAASNGTLTSPRNAGLSSLPTQASTENLCAIPRKGIDPDTRQPYLDKQGSLAIEKRWVTAFVTDTYLWYKELPVLSEASYSNPVDYFYDFKSQAVTPSGKPRDRYHYTYDTQEWYQLSQAGESVDYGISFAVIKASVPRNIVVSMVEPSAPALNQSVKRGMKLVAIDGIDFVNTTSRTDLDALTAALYPSTLGEHHQFTFTSGGVTQIIHLTAATVSASPVPLVKTMNTNSGKIAYLQFNEFLATAQTPLVNAISQLKQANITDLILDMRYNGGGYNTMSSQLAYMLAPVSKTQGKFFERIETNDKNPFNLTLSQSTYPFYSNTVDYGSGGAGLTLPNLGLNRVFVLTTPGTASASEALINGLRGVDVDVILIGSTTAGKPYGFIPQDNCGTTYFNIQFKGSNQKGYGDYIDGFTPQCTVADDFSKPLGDPAEKMLAQALHYQQFGVCNPALSKTSAVSESFKPSDPTAAFADPRAKARLRERRDLTFSTLN